MKDIQKGLREDQAASTREINTESRHATVLNRELDQSSSVKDEEGQAKEAATKGTFAANNRGRRRMKSR